MDMDLTWVKFFLWVFGILCVAQLVFGSITVVLYRMDKEKTKLYQFIYNTWQALIVFTVINGLCIIGAFIHACANSQPILTREERTQIFGENKVCCQCHKVFKCLEHDENHIVWEWGGLKKSFICDKCLTENNMNK